jgi:hypothetical protein
MVPDLDLVVKIQDPGPDLDGQDPYLQNLLFPIFSDIFHNLFFHFLYLQHFQADIYRGRGGGVPELTRNSIIAFSILK